MPAGDVSIGATFKASETPAETYSVSISAGENGSVTANPNTEVAAGTSVAVKAEPAENYEVESVSYSYTLDGTSETKTITMTDNAGSFEMPAADVTIRASFVPAAQSYTVSASASPAEGGSVTASPETAAEGADVTIKASANANYMIGTASASYTSEEGGGTVDLTLSNGEGTFKMPAGNVTVTVTFIPTEVELQKTEVVPSVEEGLGDKLAEELGLTPAEVDEMLAEVTGSLATAETNLDQIAANNDAMGEITEQEAQLKEDAKEGLGALLGEDIPLEEIKVAMKPVMDIVLKDYNPETGLIEVDINAYYNTVAYREGTEDVKPGENAVQLNEEPQKMTVSTPVDISLPLTDAIVDALKASQESGKNIMVKHVHNNRTYYYKGTLSETDKTLAFTAARGLSPFTINANAETPGYESEGTYFETLKEAIESVKNGGSINVTQDYTGDVDPIVVDMGDAESKTFKIVPAEGVTFDTSKIEAPEGYTPKFSTDENGAITVTITKDKEPEPVPGPVASDTAIFSVLSFSFSSLYVYESDSRALFSPVAVAFNLTVAPITAV